jgi:hypothetical protein
MKTAMTAFGTKAEASTQLPDWGHGYMLSQFFEQVRLIVVCCYPAMDFCGAPPPWPTEYDESSPEEKQKSERDLQPSRQAATCRNQPENRSPQKD